MFQFVAGDILESNAECLVNTVNCEGYMGKGIAYQFKLKFPENNREYVKACKNGSLKIGTIHYCREAEKLIINFPTKNKWREKSKIDYIHKGLSELVTLISSLKIKSIAIPPLGCGNGGLNWTDVKPIVIEYLEPFSKFIEIFIYEPSKYFEAQTTEAPKLNSSHLILMMIKLNLSKFNKLRLQKTAYFLNIFFGKEYFKFFKHKYGPYAHSIDILSREVKQFQEFYKVNTEEGLKLAKTIIVSKSIEQKIKSLSSSIELATKLVNQVNSDKELELIATVSSVLESEVELTAEAIVIEIKNWSEEKANKFSEAEILNAISFLVKNGIIEINLMGFYSLIKGRV
ncbi:macro domain-containing protein [Argonema antarcticum]|uniref:type II toxin-antitoxin system antitoxin DNA ADP-ribosyl glycohydrolase DarG n=1 Tax=Argonema antarcticum TaxID=2942763 RepID=UPI002012DA28|nr:macro domain-containing protein [Argonema antarcticum]MCL1475165.1 macro domain-containing protein [Argonema antarcticum A004/B2]